MDLAEKLALSGAILLVAGIFIGTNEEAELSVFFIALAFFLFIAAVWNA